MKILKLLSKKNLSVILILFITSVNSNEPVDIWNLDTKGSKENKTIIEKIGDNDKSQNQIYKMQSEKINELSIEEDETLISKRIDIFGLYDPAQNGLSLDMWSNSNGEEIINLFKRIEKLNLSKDASEILNILLLTNAYNPTENISKEIFFEIISNWLIKDSNLKIIEEYLINNQTINEMPELTKYIVDEYLSKSQIEKSCEILSKINKPTEDQYLTKFIIYCLVNDNKVEEAQLLLDLKKELGFKDNFFEKKINYLIGYEDKPDKKISEKSILDFHLSHRTNQDFKFEPNQSTDSLIWKYLSTSNLLGKVKDIELTDLDKISIIEKATHEKNYSEKELYDLYKRFQFNITQLLNIKDSSKLLTAIEARALIYQGILITTETEKKLELINALKNSFINEGYEDAFDKEMKQFLLGINTEEIPSNYTSFYYRYINEEKIESKNTKINNKILHQSKLLKYFNKNFDDKNIEKELNDLLKKIKKDKKYFFSMKDVIFIEALKSDGIKIAEKYKDLYKINDSEIPADIQILIDKGDIGVAMLRLVEVIGQDELENIDPDTMYFIISTLNQLNIDPLRNKILLKVLPLKV